MVATDEDTRVRYAAAIRYSKQMKDVHDTGGSLITKPSTLNSGCWIDEDAIWPDVPEEIA